MEQYKQEFIEFMVDSNVLKFGDFTLKSGRKSPFFMNAGAYVTGTQLRRLGEYYAKAIHDNYGLDFDVLFGPAYKGTGSGSNTKPDRGEASQVFSASYTCFQDSFWISPSSFLPKVLLLKSSS